MTGRERATREKEAREEAEQSELFGPLTTIHEVLTKLGPEQTLARAKLDALFPRPPSLPKTLAGRSGRQIVDAAQAAMIRDLEGGADRGYSYSAWSLAGLPHKDQPKNLNWRIETDFARLLIRPGVRISDSGQEEYLGVPYGSYARLLLVDWQTEALSKSSREIRMGSSLSALVARLGVSRGGPTNRNIADQLERLSSCAVDFSFGSDKRGVVVNERLVEAFSYSADPDPRAKNRLVETVLLSEAFYGELRRHPVLVDRAALQDLAGSSMAIDIYLWLAFRLHNLEADTFVGWSRLWKQFGTQVALLKNFRPQFEAPLHLALSAYPKAKVRISEKGILLEPSPRPISG